MSPSNQIADLEKLASVDLVLKGVVTELEKDQSALKALEKGLDEVSGTLRLERDGLFQAEKSRSEFTIDLRSMTHQLEQSMQKLQRSRNERETNAAQREAEELRRLIKDREEDVSKCDKDVDGRKAKIAEREAEEARLRAEIDASAGGLRTRISELSESRAKLEAERQEVGKRLPPALFKKYDMIRSKRGSGLAKSTANGVCQACNIALPPQVFAKLRRDGTLEQCQSCHRLVYFASEAAAERAPV